MQLDTLIGSVTTVVTFVTFVGIMAWAFGARRRAQFGKAAEAPFALPDESETREGCER